LRAEQDAVKRIPSTTWSALLAWLIEIDDEAKKELAKLDKPIAKRITVFLRERVAVLDDPRSIGEALKGSKLGNFWKYRVGDYRLISSIEDGTLRILVVKIGNRRDVYR
jgi:mRNA interferase RelE/StbE